MKAGRGSGEAKRRNPDERPQLGEERRAHRAEYLARRAALAPPSTDQLLQRWREENCEPERDRKAAAQRDCERAKEEPGDVGDKNQRQEDRDHRERRGDERPAELAKCALDRGVGGHSGRMAAMDRLDHHDRVIDEQPDAGRDPAERHHVERHPAKRHHH